MMGPARQQLHRRNMNSDDNPYCPVAVDRRRPRTQISETSIFETATASTTSANESSVPSFGSTTRERSKAAATGATERTVETEPSEGSTHHYAPSTDNVDFFNNRRLGRTTESSRTSPTLGLNGSKNEFRNAETSAFRQTQGLLFAELTLRRGNQKDSGVSEINHGDVTSTTRFASRKVQAAIDDNDNLDILIEQPLPPHRDRNQRFGHSKTLQWDDRNNNNYDDYRMGLFSIAICVLAVVFGWLVLLAVFWKLRGRKQAIAPAATSSNQGKEISSHDHHHEANDPETQKENPDADDGPVLTMKFASAAASPRWLSFRKKESDEPLLPRTRSVASAASKASSSGNKSGHFYKLGIVRDGKLDVSAAESGDGGGNSIAAAAENSTVDGSFGDESSTPSATTRTRTSQQKRQDLPPWNAILGALYTDLMMTCGEDDLRNLSGTSSSMYSGTSTHNDDGDDKVVDVSKFSQSLFDRDGGGGVAFDTRSVFSEINNRTRSSKSGSLPPLPRRSRSAIDSSNKRYSHSLFGGIDPNDDFSAIDDSSSKHSIGGSQDHHQHVGRRSPRRSERLAIVRAAGELAGSTTANEDEILRDLKQLEQQVNLNHRSRSTPSSSSPGGKFTAGRPTLEPRLLLQKPPPNTGALSSLLTSAMRHKDQEDLLREDGVEIWYDARARTFFRNDPPHGNATSVREEEAGGTGTNTNQQTSKKGRSWGGGVPGGYRCLVSRTIDDASHSQRDGAGSSKAASHRSSNRIWRPVYFAAAVGIIVSSFSMVLFGGNTLHKASTKTSEVLDGINGLALEGVGIVDDFLISHSVSLYQFQDASPIVGSSGIVDHHNRTKGGGDGDVLYDVFEDLTTRLFQSMNVACDFSKNNNRDEEGFLGAALEDVVGLWNDHVAASANKTGGVGPGEMVFHKLGGIQNDLVSLSEAVASLEQSWVDPYDRWNLALRICNALLGISCTALLLTGTRATDRRLIARVAIPRRHSRWIRALCAVLVIFSLVSCIVFLVGSTALMDFCGDGPDRPVLEFLYSEAAAAAANQLEQGVASVSSDHSGDGTLGWSALSYSMAGEFVRQCPSGKEGIPEEAATLVGLGWDYSRSLWEVSRLMLETDACNSEGNDNSEMGEVVMQASCGFSVVLEEFVDLFQCDVWHRLYEEGKENDNPNFLPVCLRNPGRFIRCLAISHDVLSSSFLQHDQRNRHAQRSVRHWAVGILVGSDHAIHHSDTCPYDANHSNRLLPRSRRRFRF